MNMKKSSYERKAGSSSANSGNSKVEGNLNKRAEVSSAGSKESSGKNGASGNASRNNGKVYSSRSNSNKSKSNSRPNPNSKSGSNSRPNSRSNKPKAKSEGVRSGELRFVPLGGVGEIGKNMFLLEYGQDIIILDCGLKFPDDEMLGIDYVIPDISYLEDKKDRVRAIVLTHGHEDHIGALPFVLPKLDVPVYGTKLTLGLVENKLQEGAPTYKPKFVEVKAGDVIQLGVFSVKMIAVCHSIPDAVAFGIRTPIGNVIHTGDFKLDSTPVDGRLTDFASLSEFAREGVLLMTSDSTNAEREGYTQSESILSGTLDRLLRIYRNRRLVISSFSTNLHRVQLVLDAAARFNRKVVFAGRSMVNNVDLAIRLGYLHSEDGVIVPLQEIDHYQPHRLVVMTTGSQGEPFSGLVMMSLGEHHRVRLGARDVVALFANAIPGNEKMVSNTINRLFELKCEVVYEPQQNIHVSGHASKEELKMLLSMIKPKYFVPVHGEYRMMVRHAQLAEKIGILPKNIFVMDNGDVLSIMDKSAMLKGKVQAGGILVDGLALGEKEESLVQERQELSEGGVLVVSIVLDRQGRLAFDPQFESFGLIHLDDAVRIKQEMSEAIRKIVKRDSKDERALRGQIKSRCKELLRKYIRSDATVMPIINRFEG